MRRRVRAALLYRILYQMTFSATSRRARARKSSTDCTPTSPSLRERTDTVPLSASLSPITSIYGNLLHLRFLDLIPDLFAAQIHLRPEAGGLSRSATAFTASACRSEIGSTRTCSGASQSGNAPAYFSISRARVRS